MYVTLKSFPVIGERVILKEALENMGLVDLESFALLMKKKSYWVYLLMETLDGNT